jgi:hypothetical protein
MKNSDANGKFGVNALIHVDVIHHDPNIKTGGLLVSGYDHSIVFCTSCKELVV